MQKVDRCKVVGGLEKKTSTCIKVDVDVVIFVNVPPGDILKTKNNILRDWFDILLLNTDIKEEHVKQTQHSLQFNFEGIEMDLLVAVNFSSDVAKQQKQVMQYINNNEKPAKTSSNMSAELTELAVQFVKKKSKFVHDLARLAKFWNQTILFSGYISGRSTIV